MCGNTHYKRVFPPLFQVIQNFKGPACNLIEVFNNIPSGVVNGKSQTLQKVVFFFVSLRHLDFFNCEAKTSKCFYTYQLQAQ